MREPSGAEPQAVGVVGLGLIGGSLARALVGHGVAVVGTAQDACDRHLAECAGVHVVGGVQEVAALVPRGGVVVLAVPLSALAEVADLVLGATAEGVIVLHAAGLQAAAATGLAGSAAERVIGTHPMAGSHEAGFAASRAELFAGATVWAERRADAGERRRIEGLWRVAGAARVEYAQAEVHDRTVAWASHLPQLTAVALAGAMAAGGVPARAGGPGLRDSTRLAESPFPLWRDLLAAAPPDTEAALAALAGIVDQLRLAIARRDGAALASCWEPARAWRCAGGPQSGPGAGAAGGEARW